MDVNNLLDYCNEYSELNYFPSSSIYHDEFMKIVANKATGKDCIARKMTKIMYLANPDKMLKLVKQRQQNSIYKWNHISKI